MSTLSIATRFVVRTSGFGGHAPIGTTILLVLTTAMGAIVQAPAPDLKKVAVAHAPA